MKNKNLENALVMLSQIAVKGDDVARMFVATQQIREADKDFPESEKEVEDNG